MLHVLLGDIWYHIEIGHKFVPQCMNGRNILLFHLPQTVYSSLRRETEYSNHTCHCRISRYAREPHVHQLRDVEATMEISTGGYRCWEHHTSRVDCLENALQVASSSDLLDEYGGQSFRAQFFVYTEEVNFGYFDDATKESVKLVWMDYYPLFPNSQRHWYSADECNQLPVRRYPNAYIPFRKPTRWL